MNENVAAFFARYENEQSLRDRVKLALDCYPGSLEVRESVVKNVLLPIAREEGLDFTVDDLRKYETRKKMKKAAMDNDEWLAMEDDGGDDFWLLDHGWSNDESRFCGDK
mgnify:CR=1 FL=1